MEIQIYFLGFDLLVEGNYIPEEEETNSAADFEIEYVFLLDSDCCILDLLEEHEARIKELVIEKIEE